MDEKRSERVTVGLTPSELAKVDAYAEGHRWSRSTAVADLIERGLHHAPSWDYPVIHRAVELHGGPDPEATS